MCPSLGKKNVNRARFDFAEYIKVIKMESGMRRRFIARFLTWEQFSQLKKVEGELRPDKIASTWEDMKVNENLPRDQKGHNSALRILTHLYDEIEGFEEISTSNQLHLEQKVKKNPGVDDVEAMKESLGDGHLSFKDDMYKKLGGGVAGAVASLGATFLNAAGFGSGTPGAADEVLSSSSESDSSTSSSSS